MKKSIFLFLSILVVAMLLSGCFSKVDRMTTKYYILDYKKASENPILMMEEPFAKTCEVFDTEVNRTYSRSQLVIKESFSRVSYMPWDLWANRLADAIPNLLVQRLKAYRIFRQVERSTGDVSPNYYLETNLLNIERVQTGSPRAYLRMEFKLREASSNRVLVTYLYETYKPVPANDVVQLVEVYNEMIMEATDIFAARCRLFLEAKPMPVEYPKKSEDPLVQYLGVQTQIVDSQSSDGEMLVELSFDTDAEVHYSFIETEVEDAIKREGIFGVPETLKAGKYKLLLGENQDYPVNVEIKPKMRTTVSGEWGELIVMIQDQSKNKVRLGYNLWKKHLDEYDYSYYGSDTSLGEEDFGQKEKVWILPPGTYMVKLGGGPWNELRDFTTVAVKKGDFRLLTVVVDPSGERNYMLGAGLLGNKELALGRSRKHKGAVYLDFNVTGNNDVNKDEPSYDISLVGRTENQLDYSYKSLHYSARSIYSLGLKLDSNSDLRVNPDAYSLKNVLLYTPLRKNRFLRNFSFYGRADVNTHFFDETQRFVDAHNVILKCCTGDTLFLATDQDHVRTKIAFFPLRLKEGLGITYRWVPNPKFSASIRGGYGWQQDMNRRSFIQLGSNWSSQIPGDTLSYEVYMEDSSSNNSGIESTLVLSAVNILGLLTINSSVDVLFPMLKIDQAPRLESETRFNLRLYRNISMDFNVNVEYDKQRRDWWVYNYGSYLRLSLFY